MEIRSNYIAVGVFSLFILAAILLTISWLNKDEQGEKQNKFSINFKESVRGLTVGSPVLFSGIRVGQVKSITISRTEPGTVQVQVMINAEVPIRENSEARLDLMGLTGGSVISITGGTADSPVLGYIPDQERTLHAQQSSLSAVMRDVPNTLAMVNRILNNMDGFLTKENQENTSKLLSSLATVSSAIAGNSNNIDTIINDSALAVKEVSKVMQHFSNTASHLDKLINKTGPEVERLTSESFPQLKVILVQTKELIDKLKYISEKFDSDPKQYLLGEPVRQYQP